MRSFSPRARAHMDRAAAAAQKRDPRETAQELGAAYDKGTSEDRARIESAVRRAFTRRKR